MAETKQYKVLRDVRHRDREYRYGDFIDLTVEEAEAKPSTFGLVGPAPKEGPTERYKVLSVIHHDGREYKPGQFVRLTAKEAGAMPWAVEAPGAPAAVEVPAEQSLPVEEQERLAVLRKEEAAKAARVMKEREAEAAQK